jgi:hypothetical protein
LPEISIVHRWCLGLGPAPFLLFLGLELFTANFFFRTAYL